MVGLADVAGRRAGSFSLGMGQRLGIASALLADPQTLILDEPVNGLDPDGVRWIRNLLQRPRRRGPHRLPVLAPDERDGADRRPRHRGRPGPAAARPVDGRVHRRRPRPTSSGSARRRRRELAGAAGAASGVTVRDAAEDALEVEGLSSDEIGTVAAAAQITLYELSDPGRVAGGGLHGPDRGLARLPLADRPQRTGRRGRRMSSPATGPHRPRHVRRRRVRQRSRSRLPRVISSEWIKFRTLRSTWAVLGAASSACSSSALIVAYNTRHLTQQSAAGRHRRRRPPCRATTSASC